MIKYLILILALFILLIGFSYLAFFSLSLQINEKVEICLNALVPSKVLENEIFQVQTFCKNCGSVSSYFYVEITFFNDRTAKRYLSNFFFLHPSEELNLISNFSLASGIYNVSVRCIAENVSKELNTSIIVEKRLISIGASAPIALPAFRKVEITYPKELNITQDVIEFVIKVKNLGALLTNVKMNYSSLLDINLIYPKELKALSYNETINFLFRINATNFKEGLYTANFCLLSNEYQECFKINFFVLKLEKIEKIKVLIEYYENIIKEILKEISELESIGKDTSLAKNYLNNASLHLNTAKNFFRFEFYGDAIKELEKVREFIILTVVEISRLSLSEFPQKRVEVYYAFQWQFLLYFIFALIIVLIILILAKRIDEYLKYRSIYYFKLKKLRL